MEQYSATLMKFHEFGESSSWRSLCAHVCQSS